MLLQPRVIPVVQDPSTIRSDHDIAVTDITMQETELVVCSANSYCV